MIAGLLLAGAVGTATATADALVILPLAVVGVLPPSHPLAVDDAIGSTLAALGDELLVIRGDSPPPGPHVVALPSVAIDGERCLVRLELRDRPSGRLRGAAEALLRQCGIGPLLLAGDRLARDVARYLPRPVEAAIGAHLGGPRPLTIPDLPDLPPVRLSTVAPRGEGLVEERVRTYEAERIRVIRRPGQGSLVLSYGRVVDDCDLMRLGGEDVPPALERACRGNWWELAWLSAPIAGLLVGAGVDDLITSGDLPFTLVSGAAIGLTGAILALALDEDEPDFEDGEHVLPEDKLWELAGAANAALLGRLGLTPLEVEVERRYARAVEGR